MSFEQPLYILYSSGTTGVPKGVRQTHRNVVAQVEAVIARAQSAIGTPYVWGGGDANGPTTGVDGGSVDIIGQGSVPSEGMKRGSVVNLERATHAIRQSVQAAERVGATVRWLRLDPATGELDLASLDVIGERTRLVALTAASNLLGTRPPVATVAARAHEVGARAVAVVGEPVGPLGGGPDAHLVEPPCEVRAGADVRADGDDASCDVGGFTCQVEQCAPERTLGVRHCRRGASDVGRHLRRCDGPGFVPAQPLGGAPAEPSRR